MYQPKRADSYFYRRTRGFFGYPDILRYRGSVIPAIIPYVSLVTLVSFTVCILYLHFGLKISISNSIIPSLSVVLGLLVAMRTNTAYDRYWEGRRLWAQMQTSVRMVARTIWLGIPEGHPNSLKEKSQAMDLLLAFMMAIKHHLREEHELKHMDYVGLLPEQFSVYASESANLPLEISYRLSQFVLNLSNSNIIGGSSAGAISSGISAMMDAFAQMERIRFTPIPLAYLIHMKQAITFYCFLLPFTMVEALAYLTIPLVGLVAFTLFGIDGIGAEIENPFGYDLNDLNIDYYCEEIRDEVVFMKKTIPTSSTTQEALSL